MGKLLPFWRNVVVTEGERAAPEIVPPARQSLDDLLFQIRHTGGRVVHCQCELSRAELAHEAAKDAYYEALVEIDKEVQVFKGRTI